MDGEIMIPGKGFNDVQSAVMSEDGTPDFQYWVFDNFSTPSEPFIRRFNIGLDTDYTSIIQHVPSKMVQNENELLAELERNIALGYEGIIVRDPHSPYKFGRSTVNEGYLLKVKKFFDDEAVLLDIVEKQHNTNPKEKDEIGNTKRSTKKDGMVPANTSGTFIAKWNDKEIKLGFGEGITDIHKQEFWDNKSNYIGKTLTFKYQELSPDGIPRFGKFVGFRYDL